MAYTAISNPLSARIQRKFDAFFASVGQGFNSYMEIMSRRHEIEELYAKSDAQLAEMGLTREDIPLHVFRDRFGC